MAKKKDEKPPEVQRSEADQQAREEAIRLMKEAQARAAKEAQKNKGKKQEEPTDDDQEDSKKKSSKKPPKKKKVFDENGVPMLGMVKVYSPFRTYYDGPAYSVSALNGTGVFDVLPGHKNFLSLLLPYEVVIHGKKGEDRLKIERGIMHVADDEIIIFLDV